MKSGSLIFLEPSGPVQARIGIALLVHCIHFLNVFLTCKGVELQLIVFSFCIHSYLCIMAWWWPEFRVQARCHVIKLFAKCVLVVIVNLEGYYVPISSTYKDLQFVRTIFLVLPQILTVNTNYISMYTLKWFFFVMDRNYVLCKIRNESSVAIEISFLLQMVNMTCPSTQDRTNFLFPWYLQM